MVNNSFDKEIFRFIKGIGCFAILFLLVVIAFGAWGFVELITWITSK